MCSRLAIASKQSTHWTFEVLSALHKIPGADVHISAIMSHSKISMGNFELLLRSKLGLDRCRVTKLTYCLA